MSSEVDNDNRRLHYELERAITEMNKEQIGVATGGLGHADFEQVAQMVACLRARYLSTVLSMAKNSGKECIDTKSALQLKSLREAYQEALAGFDALEHALKRDYISFSN
jgi:hypothetical protein